MYQLMKLFQLFESLCAHHGRRMANFAWTRPASPLSRDHFPRNYVKPIRRSLSQVVTSHCAQLCTAVPRPAGVSCSGEDSHG